MHPIFAEQLRRLGLRRDGVPPLAAWQEFADWANKTYANMDRERAHIQECVREISDEVDALTSALASERDKFASAFRAVANGMAITDVLGHIVEVNPALEAMVGIPQNQLIGKPVWELTESDSASFRATLESLAAARTTSAHEHYRLTSGRAELVLADVNCTVVNGFDGVLAFLVVVVHDVTEKTRLEVELRHAQKLESVGRLAAGIAHEINTPIQFVGDNVTFLADAFQSLLGLCRTYQRLCDLA